MKPEFENIPLIHDEKAHRFELTFNGFTCYIQYKKVGAIWSLDETKAPDELIGTGAAKALVEKVFAKIRDENQKIYPVCSYLSHIVQRNPEWKSIVDSSFPEYEKL